MSSPLDVIKSGIDEGDWQKVCDGFNAMTGAKLEPPSSTLEFHLPREALEQLKTACREGGYSAVQAAAPFFKYAAEKSVPPVEAQAKVKQGKVSKAKSEPVVVSVSPPPPPATRPVSDLDKFRVKHAGRQGDKRYASREAHEGPSGPNRFVDDGTEAKNDIAIDRAMSGNRSPSPRRPAVRPVTLSCSRCQAEKEVPAGYAPRPADAGDNAPAYVCDDCISKSRKSR